MRESTRQVKFPEGRNTAILYVPAMVARDTSFPFSDGERVTVKIDGQKLIIEKA